MEKNCIICNSAFLSNYPKVICCSKICVRKNYYNNNKRKILKRVYAYKKTEKGKLTQKRYGKSSKGRSMQNRWRKSSKGKKYFKKYKKTKKFKTANAKYEKTNINRRIGRAVRGRVVDFIKRSKTGHSKSATKIIGCSINYLRKHLEQSFYNHPLTNKKMSWDNYGVYGWHIDHWTPCSQFNLSDDKQRLKCFHYSNLNPMWAYQNIKKSNKIINENKAI